jgi:hypothetical protein
LQNITATLPNDYLELIELTEGLTVGTIGILGLSQIYEVVMPDWNYYLIAELNSVGTLGIKAHTTNREIYLLKYDGEPPWRNMGDSLASTIGDLLAER